MADQSANKRWQLELYFLCRRNKWPNRKVIKCPCDLVDIDSYGLEFLSDAGEFFHGCIHGYIPMHAVDLFPFNGLSGKFAHALAVATSKQILQSSISLFINPCPDWAAKIFPSLIIFYVTHIGTYQKFRQARVPSGCSDHKGGKIFLSCGQKYILPNTRVFALGP